MFETYKAAGATYGQFTGATLGEKDTANPVIADGRAWYWVEILNYSYTAAVWAEECAPSKGLLANGDFFYRITGVAVGRSGVPSVIQEIFIPAPAGESARGCPL